MTDKTTKDADRLAKLALDRAKAGWGYAGWANLSPLFREAFVAKEVTSIFMCWDESGPMDRTFPGMVATAALRLACPENFK
jgi:hypothetical protein